MDDLKIKKAKVSFQLKLYNSSYSNVEMGIIYKFKFKFNDGKVVDYIKETWCFSGNTIWNGDDIDDIHKKLILEFTSTDEIVNFITYNQYNFLSNIIFNSDSYEWELNIGENKNE